MLYFIWVFTVCQSTHLRGSSIQRIKGESSFKVSKKISIYKIILNKNLCTKTVVAGMKSHPDSEVVTLNLFFVNIFYFSFNPLYTSDS